MTKPTFKMEISITTVISLLFPLLALAVTWGQFTSRFDAFEAARDESNKRILTEMNGALASRQQMEQRLRYVEEQVARTDERYTIILEKIMELKENVEDIANKSGNR